MKDHYDFSKGVRGKFHNPNAVFKLPVYLDEQVQGYLSAKADAKGIGVGAVRRAAHAAKRQPAAACPRRATC